METYSCPNCGGDVVEDDEGLYCEDCGYELEFDEEDAA